jgi:hypothetical protein
MKDNKYIQSFNEHQENLNISDVSDSKKSKVEDFSVGDKIHVIQLNKASAKFKMMYEETYGEVIKILSPTEVEQMTGGGFAKVVDGIKDIGLLVKLEPNKVDNISTRFGGFSAFRNGEFVLTNNDVFVGV